MQGKKFNLKAMVDELGWMSLYDGIAAGLWRQLFYASTRFGLFETFRDKLHEYRGKTDFASRYVVYVYVYVYVYVAIPFVFHEHFVIFIETFFCGV